MDRPKTASYKSLFDSLNPLRTQWVGGGWSWDPRFSCVSSSFSVDLTEEALQAVRRTFPLAWDAQGLAKAPSLIREIAQQTGGIREDQTLYCLNPVAGSLVYGLWWPWGDDVTISFRVGLAGSAAVREEYQLRETFNALD